MLAYLLGFLFDFGAKKKFNLERISARGKGKGKISNEDLFMSRNFIFQPAVHSEQCKYTTFKKEMVT